jgi:hypothetical protein
MQKGKPIKKIIQLIFWLSFGIGCFFLPVINAGHEITDTYGSDGLPDHTHYVSTMTIHDLLKSESEDTYTLEGVMSVFIAFLPALLVLLSFKIQAPPKNHSNLWMILAGIFLFVAMLFLWLAFCFELFRRTPPLNYGAYLILLSGFYLSYFLFSAGLGFGSWNKWLSRE